MVNEYPEHVELRAAAEIMKRRFGPAKNRKPVEKNISDSLGYVLTRDVVALRNVPHYAASAVDGYAVEASCTAGATPGTPVTLGTGRYAWVNTGSDVPHWANSVLMVEDSSLAGDDLLVYRSLTPSANIRPLGEDVMAGQIIAREGDLVTPALISLFLCAGLEKAPVFAKPGTLFIPTGDEVVDRGEWLSDPRPRSGTVAESNSLFIESSFREWGFEVDVTAIVPDDPEILRDKILEGVKKYDLVLVGAGSAKGRRDHTFDVLNDAGEILFRWIRMKPGRPAMAAEIKGKPVVCLPGFPMSTTVVLWSMVYPLLNILSGREGDYEEQVREAAGTLKTLETKLLIQHSSSPGIEEWLRMQIAMVNGTLYSWALTSGASVLWALAEADGISLLPASALECEKGTDVTVWMRKNVDFKRRVLFQGSDDPAIQLLITPIRRRGGDMICRAVGSMGGLAALSRGECHLAAAHLLDDSTGAYNDSFIERFSGGASWERVLVFYRSQGIIVQPGNPKKIYSFEDLCAGDNVFSNRQPGAGTRVLFDHLLKKAGKPTSEIKGYGQQCTTHMEAANRVFTGLADATIGIKSAADALGLDFIPLTEEPYELVIPSEHMDHPAIRALLESLEDGAWKAAVQAMGGYRWAN